MDRNLLIATVLVPALGGTVFCRAAEVFELEPFYVRSRAAPVAPVGVSGEAWRSSGTAGLAELLENSEPGLALVRKAGMANDVVIRGLGADDISVTLDGRAIYCACSNRMDPPLSHASAENTAAIEVAAGPFSVRRPGSLGGRINVVPAPIEDGRHGYLNASVGSFNAFQSSGWGSLADDRFGVLAQGAYMISDPYENGSGVKLTEFPQRSPSPLDDYRPEYIDAVAYEAWHAGGRATWRLGDTLRLSADGLRRQDRGVLYPGLKMDADTTYTTRLGLRLEGSDTGGLLEDWVADAYWNDTDHVMSDRRRLSSIQSDGAGTPRPPFILDRGYFMLTDASASNFGATFDAELGDTGFGEWAVGAGTDHRFWDSDNTIGPNDNAMLPDTVLSNAGVYAEGRFAGEGPWSAEAGVRLDGFHAEARGDTAFLRARQGTDRDRDFLLPGAFASVRRGLPLQFGAFAGVGSVARSPNAQELYIQVDKPGNLPTSPADWVGNPDLDAPRSTEVTGGVDYRDETVYLRARVFHAWLSDTIYQAGLRPPGEAPLQTYENIDARLYGVELSGEWRIAEHWRTTGALAWQEGVKETRPTNATNDYLAGIPPLRGQATIEFDDGNWALQVLARASASQNRVDTDLFEQDLGAWWTLSATVSKRFGRNLSAALAVANLFDSTYAVHNAQVANPFSAFTVVDEPGRTITLSAAWEF